MGSSAPILSKTQGVQRPFTSVSDHEGLRRLWMYISSLVSATTTASGIYKWRVLDVSTNRGPDCGGARPAAAQSRALRRAPLILAPSINHWASTNLAAQWFAGRSTRVIVTCPYQISTSGAADMARTRSCRAPFWLGSPPTTLFCGPLVSGLVEAGLCGPVGRPDWNETSRRLTSRP